MEAYLFNLDFQKILEIKQKGRAIHLTVWLLVITLIPSVIIFSLAVSPSNMTNTKFLKWHCKI